jgi:transketolase
VRGSRVAASQAVAVDRPSSRDGKFGIRALLGRVDAYADEPGIETAPAEPRNFDTEVLAGAIRQHVVRMTHAAGTSHVGSMLSMTDLVAVLYGKVLRVDPARPEWHGRDRFLLSKGHAGGAVYAALAETGFFHRRELAEYACNGARFSGHISHKQVPGVELSTGALGHGLGVGVGMAKAGKLAKHDYRVFVMLSDGECDEGSNWEAIMFAAHHGLDNLVAIVDYNKIQSLASVADTMALEPFADKWRSFGWTVREVDGHDHDHIADAFAALPFAAGHPNCVIAHTVKGKGVSFMENTVLWHYRSPQGEEFEAAMRELGAKK